MKLKKLMGVALAGTLTLSAFAGAVAAETAKLPTDEAYAAGKTAVSYAEDAASDEMAGYLYVHFVGTEQSQSDEQLYFSISPNAKDWYVLNNGNSVSPITASNPEGSQGGIRDPYILRKHDGSGFFIIATDLSIVNIGGNWGASQQNGSHNIIVWETDDLTDLGEPRMVEIAPENATCTWAPEAVWDDEKQSYMVFWSVLANKSWNDDGEWKTGMYWTHHVYRCYTDDFVNFTEPEVYIESEQQTIDSTIIKEGDTYYRFTKIESDKDDSFYNPNYGSKTIFMEKCKSLSGEWEMVTTYKLDGMHWSKYPTAFEGPSIFKLNPKDTDGKDQWCLMLDDFVGVGYTPFMTNDLEKGEFTKATDISFDTHGRHGAFMSLKKSEYDALLKKYNLQLEETEREHKEVFSLSFEDDATATVGTATAHGSIEYVDGVKTGTKAAKLTMSDQDYIEVDGSALAGLDGFTVSFAAKMNHPTGDSSGRSWFFYAARNNDPIIWNANGTHEKYVGLIWGEGGSQTLAAQRFWDGRTPSPSATVAASESEWKHITVVFGKRYTSIFVNGEQVARTASAIDLTTILENTPTVYIGRAQWSGGEYSDCTIDEFKIHNWGMSAEEVKTNYQSVMGVQA